MAVLGLVKKPGSSVRREKGATVSNSIPSTSISGFIGDTIRGPVNQAVLITSWKQYQDIFTLGYSNPYACGLTEHVQRFFDNGGSDLYVVRVVGDSATKAKATIPASTGVPFEATELGAWGNDISIKVATNSDAFDIIISLKGTKVEEFKSVTQDTMVDILSKSKYVRVTNTGTLADGTGALTTGSNGSELALKNYSTALQCFNVIKDNILLAIPGVVTSGVQEALATYSSSKTNIFGVHDGALNATDEDIESFKEGLTGYSGALYHPWMQVIDPVSGNVKDFPLSSSLCGLYARTDAERGIQKSPAGVDAVIIGAVGVSQQLSDEQIGVLNSKNINCITTVKNKGVVVWGARLLSEDADRKFVSDLRLDMFMDRLLEVNTNWVTFEPIDESLFSKVQSQIKGLLDGLWREGKFKGKKAEDAYFVQCDEANNPDENASEVIIDVGYAKKKPAEFILTRITQMRE